LAAYQAARNDFLQGVAAMIGGGVLAVDLHSDGPSFQTIQAPILN
jgi:hypothetical protein